MSYFGGNARASASTTAPEAWAICDRCGFLHNHKDLTWQFQYAGNRLYNTRLLVCAPCLDIPHEFNRPLYLSADPEPVPDARPPAWTTQEAKGPAIPNQTVRQLIDLD